MKSLRLGLCLQLIAFAFSQNSSVASQKTVPTENQTVANESQRPIFTNNSQNPIFTNESQSPIFTNKSQNPIFTNKSQSPIFTCEKELKPYFLVDLNCWYHSDEETRTLLSGLGLILSDLWILSTGHFLMQNCKIRFLKTICFMDNLLYEIYCETMILHEQYNENRVRYNLAVVKAERQIKAVNVPWPQRGFSYNCTDLVLYGPGEGSRRNCTKLSFMGTNLTNCSANSLLCAESLDEKVVKTISEGGFRTGLAVCNDVVVGIVSETSIENKTAKVILTKIDDYYEFIFRATGLEIPFKSSPNRTKEDEDFEKQLTAPSTKRTSTERTSKTTRKLKTKTTTELPLQVISCQKVTFPAFIKDIRCGEGHYRYTSGFIISVRWALGAGSFFKRYCEPDLTTCMMDAAIYRFAVQCEKIIYHEKFSDGLHYDLALIKGAEKLAFSDDGNLLNIPWPKKKGFSENCTHMSFYGFKGKGSEITSCTNLRMLGWENCSHYGDHHHSAEESILCTRTRKKEWEKDNCWTFGQGALAVCDNIVVGINSHNHTNTSCDENGVYMIYVLTKIEDYFTFIEKTTGVKVPFQSSPGDVPPEDISRRAKSNPSAAAASAATKLNGPWFLFLLSLLLVILV